MGNKQGTSKKKDNTVEESDKLVANEKENRPNNKTATPSKMADDASREIDIVITEHDDIVVKRNENNVVKRRDKSKEPYDQYLYPFENLVFEGGGNKGLAYCGAVRILEDFGLWPQIKRLSGTNAGAMLAALLAVGYTSQEIEKFLTTDLRRSFMDHFCGTCCFTSNFQDAYGWNPGQKVLSWFGQKLKKKTGKTDITFMEVYKRFGKELCVVVTNVSKLSAEYCHPKTTPNMSVKLAVRMSMAIPGLFQAVRHKKFGKETNVYVDGSVLCNYPINCFDGWWLSMAQEDSFLRKLQPLTDMAQLCDKDERFGIYNKKTLGFMLYSNPEANLFQKTLAERIEETEPKIPETKLSRKRKGIQEAHKKTFEEQERLLATCDRFLLFFREQDMSGENGQLISSAKLEELLEQYKTKSDEDFKILFGEKAKVKDAVKVMGADKKQPIAHKEIVQFLENKAALINERIHGHQKRDIRSYVDFAHVLDEALSLNSNRINVEKRDLMRTVGVNTHYIETSDMGLHKLDKEFLYEQGKAAMKQYLLYYITHMKPPLRNDCRKSFCMDDLRYFIDDDIQSNATEIINERDYRENFRLLDSPRF